MYFRELKALLAVGLFLGQFAQPVDAESFIFKFPQKRELSFLRVVPPLPSIAGNDLLRFSTKEQLAYVIDTPDQTIWLTHRIVVQVQNEDVLDALTLKSNIPTQGLRKVSQGVYLIETADAAEAARLSHRLASSDAVIAAYPVTRPRIGFHRPYADAPNDPFFPSQWNFENRDAKSGMKLGVDLNLRGAWALSKGRGIIIGIGDDGIDSTHEDLEPNVAKGFQTNFVHASDGGDPLGPNSNHGTAVAGLAAAKGNNRRGLSGAAPDAKLASWIIFDQNDLPATEEQLMHMFQTKSNLVAIQNHSWGNPRKVQLEVGMLEAIGMSNAVTFGRSGRGVVVVRSAGNNRLDSGNLNDDAYANNPLVIAVGAVRADGRTTRYTNPGASLLVSAPSSEGNELNTAIDPAFPALITTDRVGSAGFNTLIPETNPELADYGFGATAFSGTSGAAPQVAGIAALILSHRPELGYRDVQQILLWSARQTNPDDPDIRTNSTGLKFTHNNGYGVPDASFAMKLASMWSNRPPTRVVNYAVSTNLNIPDDGLRVFVEGDSIPTNLVSIVALPSLGPQPDGIQPSLPLVDVGLATNKIAENLAGKGALIFRSSLGAGVSGDEGHTFSNKITQAAIAGAAFAIVSNERNGNERVTMSATDWVRIPAVSISQNDGEALRLFVKQRPETKVRLGTVSATLEFNVTNSFSLEHVGLKLLTSHRRRGDWRLTLFSPSGTRSILQRRGLDTTSGFGDWTYYSTQHFYENAKGRWVVEITDENPGVTGTTSGATLILSGIPIQDTDLDGLEDSWEILHFAHINAGATGDEDFDGYSNLIEFLLGTNPRSNEFGHEFTLSKWNDTLLRLSWSSKEGTLVRPVSTAQLPGKFNSTTLKPIASQFPESELFVPLNSNQGYFDLIPAP